MLNVVIFALIGFVVVAAAIVLLSFLVEAMRPVPPTPERLSWAPDVPIRYISVNGVRLRYIKTGEGPVLVLLHTLRTQLDLFEKVVPELAKSFTLYAVDYPGHGYSDVPAAKYNSDYFVETIESFLEALDLHDVTLAGVSIGASISLILAARNNPRVSRVVAINPYDYAKGRGMARSSSRASLRRPGGSAGPGRHSDAPASILHHEIGARRRRIRPAAYFAGAAEGDVSGRQPTRSLSRLPQSAPQRRNLGNGDYGLFEHSIPVLLLWGDRDWSRLDEREHDRQIVPGARMATVEDGGHFLPLDRPDAVVEHLLTFQASNLQGDGETRKNAIE